MLLKKATDHNPTKWLIHSVGHGHRESWLLVVVFIIMELNGTTITMIPCKHVSLIKFAIACGKITLQGNPRASYHTHAYTETTRIN